MARRLLRGASRLAVVALGLALPGACASVFGLDEPTVRDGEGGASSASTGAAPSTSAPGSGPTTSGTGTGGDASSQSGTGGATSAGGGGSGGVECQEDGDCDDENPCTTDACDDDRCQHDPVPDGPLGGTDDPNDCRDVTCRGGERVDVADDTEDPADANPPCEPTICKAGAVSPDYAVEGTSCGGVPQECDGAGVCVGCDPSGPGTQCGSPTECSNPTCIEPGICDPGYVDAGTPVTDPTDGDCKGLACTGDSIAPFVVNDDSDALPDLPCGDRGCSGGVPTVVVLGSAEPCNGETGVCDGLGTASANCVVCRDDVVDAIDAGCTAPLPNCDENAGLGDEGVCRECIGDQDCELSEVGFDCLPSYQCGCNGGGMDCDGSPYGDTCDLGRLRCGCELDNDCNDSERGHDCLPSSVCGCNNDDDCSVSDWGELCVLATGACGCEVDQDCSGSATCNTTTSRCE